MTRLGGRQPGASARSPPIALARFHLRFGLNQSALVVALLVRMLPPILLVIPLYIMLASGAC